MTPSDDAPADAAPTAASRVVFPGTLLLTMTASAFQIFALAILASPIISELDLSRAQLGLIGSVNTAVGAVTAPATGRLTDRIGPRRAVSFVLGFSAAGMALMAFAPSMWWLFLATAVGGVAQGWGNPATNSLIATRVAPGRRGGVTGVKQSGVTLGVFLSGFALPGLEAAWDWRAASLAFAVAFTALAVAVHLTLGPDPDTSTGHPAPSGSALLPRRLDPFVVRLAVYALLMGIAGGAVGRFFPLYAEEALGFSLGTAGVLTAIGGLLGMAARVVVGRLAEARFAPTRLLSVLALVGASYCVLLAVVTESTRGLLFLAPPLSAVGIAAWNSVAMLAIIMFFSTAQAGRASGVVMLGFLGGMSISAPVAGFTVDRIGVYWPVWAVAAALALIAATLMWFDTTGRTPDHTGAADRAE